MRRPPKGKGKGSGDSDDVPQCGLPHISVNLFTGDLIIRDMLVYSYGFRRL